MSKKKIVVVAGIFLVGVILVWGVSAVLLSGAAFWTAGLAMTVCGATVLVAYVLISRFATEKSALADAAQPAASPPSDYSVGSAEVKAAFDEANDRLLRSRALASVQAKPSISSLPLILMAGPENSGKTTAFVNSGLSPELLSGTVQQQSGVAPTRVCNIWFSQGIVVVEAAGGIFAPEPAWKQFLGSLKSACGSPEGRPRAGGGTGGFRSLVLLCDISNFLGVPEPGRQNTLLHNFRERMRYIAEAFGTDYPVYFLFTNADKLPFFSDYFNAITEAEAKQVLGFVLPAVAGASRAVTEVYAEAETRRFNDYFNEFYHSLMEKRLMLLARESGPGRKPGIYEFPREMRRARGAMVQFLVEAFRPAQLQPGPMLRGVYFTGVRKVPAGAAAGGAVAIPGATLGAEGATRLFRLEDLQKGGVSHTLQGGEREPLVSRSCFVSDLFARVILADRLAPARSYERRQSALNRTVAGWALAGVAILLCVIFAYSWWQNRELLNGVYDTLVRTEAPETPALGEPSAKSLGELDALLSRLETLVAYTEEHRPLGFRWGLYTAGRTLPLVRELYFDRFRQYLLNDVVRKLERNLGSLPLSQQAAWPYDAVYTQLKTYLTITPQTCKVEPQLPQAMLDVWRGSRPADDAQLALVRRQFEFYAKELAAKRLPFRLDQDGGAVRAGQSYLSQSSPLDRIFRGLVEEAERAEVLRRARLSDLTTHYAAVLTGPSEMDTAYTRDGYRFLDDRIHNLNTGALGESCVFGGVQVARLPAGGDIAQELQNRYIHEYSAAWKLFLAHSGVVGYKQPADAADKLEILVNNDSPLLALLFMVSENTSGFPAPGAAAAAPAGGKQSGGFFNKVRTKLGKIPSKAPEPEQAAPAAAISPNDINTTFQPVHALFAPAANRNHFVDDKNKSYVMALADLQRAMRALAQSSTPETDTALNADANRAYNAALDNVRQAAYGFDRNPEQIDVEVRRLLEAPIRAAQGLFVTDITKNVRDKTNGDLGQLCGKIKPLLRKIPFDPRAEEGVTLGELTSVFSPQSGALWQFFQQHLAGSLVRTGASWAPKPDAPGPRVVPEFLQWLNRVQAITDALFSGRSPQPGTRFSLTGTPSPNAQGLTWNGESFGSAPKQFAWPGEGVLLRVVLSGGDEVPYAVYSAPWGIFQLMADADARSPGSRRVSLTNLRGQGRGSQPGQVMSKGAPVSVQLEIAEFPGGVENAFDKTFFAGLGCPVKAVP
jgi:type VI secretion system protein ImpL